MFAYFLPFFVAACGIGDLLLAMLAKNRGKHSFQIEKSKNAYKYQSLTTM